MLLKDPSTGQPAIPANTPQWIRERVGHGTASRANDMFGFQKRNPELELACRENYRYEVVEERVNDVAAEHWVSEWMIRGQKEEPNCKAALAAKGIFLGAPMFIHHPSIAWLGATPDGFIGHDALCEIKVPKSAKFIRWCREGIVPEEHRSQMLVQLACTRRARCLFASYNPDGKVGPKLFIRWFEPKPSEISEAEEKAAEFLHGVETLFHAFVEMGEVA